LDHLELALQAAEADASAAEFAKGVRLVQGELGKALGRVGIEAFSPQGERFDPEHHEAMAQQPAPEGAEPGTVITVYQQGYRLNGTVLRPARVVVAG
ncbi:MAG TPA: nucleotide exchange factor GrpE, partial [Solirubrobacteraceae bacterium]